jgi:hypothetical protein
VSYAASIAWTYIAAKIRDARERKTHAVAVAAVAAAQTASIQPSITQ